MNVNEFFPDIQYKNSAITECSIKNNILSAGKDASLTCDVGVEVSELFLSDDKTEKLGTVRLTVACACSIERNGEEGLCECRVVTEGTFSTAPSTTDEKFLQLLWFNGSTALYSIVRGKIETISSTVFHMGKISLPMINMYELLKAQHDESMSQDSEIAAK